MNNAVLHPPGGGKATAYENFAKFDLVQTFEKNGVVARSVVQELVMLCDDALQPLSDTKCIHELLAESNGAFNCPFRTTSTKAFVWKPNHSSFCTVSQRTDRKQLR